MASAEPLPFEETFNKIGKTIQANLPGIQSRLQDLMVRLKPLLLRLEELWLPYLAKIKTRLPESIQTQFSDRTLTSLLAGLLIFLLWTINGITSGSPQEPVAQAPRTAQPTAIAQRPDTVQPVTRPVRRLNEPITAPSDTIAAPPLNTQNPIATPVRRRSSSPSAIPVNTGGATEAVSSLQQAFVTLSNPYVEDLILSVLPDTPAHRVMLKVSSAWYDLEAEEQDRLAEGLLRSSQKFKFEKLEIKDSQNDLLARTPVVGDQIVILRRHKVTTS